MMVCYVYPSCLNKKSTIDASFQLHTILSQSFDDTIALNDQLAQKCLFADIDSPTCPPTVQSCRDASQSEQSFSLQRTRGQPILVTR